MQIARVRTRIVNVPLRIPFDHATKSRSATENVVTEVELSDGSTGIGEGVPREYVTGESARSAHAAIAGLDYGELAPGFASLGDLVSYLAERDPPPVGNAAWCSLELALLDAFGKSLGRPIGEVAPLVLPPEMVAPRSRVRYGVVVSGGASRKRVRRAARYRLFGFNEMKVKVGLDDDDDVAALAAIRRRVGNRVDLRVDANGVWDADRAARMCERLSPFTVSCVEQPLPTGSEGDLPRLRGSTDTPIMLDESLNSLGAARRAVAGGWCDVFNVRISKLGGFVASLKAARIADEAGLKYALGCQVGETAILSAAGRHFAATVGGIRYLEGSYDRFLLAANVTRRPVSFGWGGFARAMRGPGLGIEIHQAALDALTTELRDIEL